MNSNFLSLFGGIFQDEKLKEIISRFELKNMNILKAKNLMTLEVFSPFLVKGSDSDKIEAEIAKALNLWEVKLNVKMPSECFSEEYFPVLVKDVKAKIAASNGY